jgi:replicative DNA helicase
VLALSQLSRAPEMQPGRKPELWHLRESGSIEQDADVVMFIVRQDEKRGEGEEAGADEPGIKVELRIEKQRNGPTGRVPLVFLRPYVRFENIAREPAPEPEPLT